jgi:hypothetical protein
MTFTITLDKLTELAGIFDWTPRTPARWTLYALLFGVCHSESFDCESIINFMSNEFFTMEISPIIQIAPQTIDDKATSQALDKIKQAMLTNMQIIIKVMANSNAIFIINPPLFLRWRIRQ